MKEASRATMQDVADKVGVSKMSVSLALRNHPSIPLATRRRILRIAQSLNYQPNPLVAALMTELRTKRRKADTCTIGYITQNLPTDEIGQSITMRKFHRGAKERAGALGFQLEEFSLSEKGMSINRMNRVLWQRNIRGLILAPSPTVVPEPRFNWEYFAAVALGFSIGGRNFHRVANYHERTMLLVLENLHRCGYRRPAVMVREDVNSKVAHGFFAGYDIFLRAHSGCRRIPELLVDVRSPERFVPWFKKWRPDAIATFDFRTVAWLEELGVAVPDEVGVGMLSIHPESSSLSGADQHAEVIGATAVDVVVEEMNHNRLGLQKFPKTVFLESDWVDGSSTRRI